MEAVRGKTTVFADKRRSSRTDRSAASQLPENELSGFDHFDCIDRRDLRCVYNCFPLPNARAHGCVERAAAFDDFAGNKRSAVGQREPHIEEPFRPLSHTAAKGSAMAAFFLTVGRLQALRPPSASGWLRRFAVPAVGAVCSHFLDTPRPPIYGPRRRTPTAADFPQFWMV